MFQLHVNLEDVRRNIERSGTPHTATSALSGSITANIVFSISCPSEQGQSTRDEPQITEDPVVEATTSQPPEQQLPQKPVADSTEVNGANSVGESHPLPQPQLETPETQDKQPSPPKSPKLTATLSSAPKEDKAIDHELHSRARSRHPLYPTRFDVPDEKVLWSEPFPEYSPTEYTAEAVNKFDRWIQLSSSIFAIIDYFSYQNCQSQGMG